jgi:hypothetical protein
MPLSRRETELSVERPLGPGGPAAGVARLTVRFAPAPGGADPTPSELRAALVALTADLDAIVGPPLAAAPAARPDRELAELIETYRPRQRELVDLLRDDGEITPSEHDRLIAHLAERPAGTLPPPRTPEPVPDQPIAAAPIGSERSLPPARPVPELLKLYQIASLKQAGAVRARRQISFAEYMALKRHFEEAERDTEAPRRPP